MKQHISAGIIVYKKKEETLYFLLLHYRDGHWDFPKGHLEHNETVAEAAHRELEEETGLTATIDTDFSTTISYYFTDKNGKKIHKTVNFFTGQADNEAVVLSHEHQHFIWLPYEQARKQLTYQNARDVLTKAYTFLEKSGNGIHSESTRL